MADTTSEMELDNDENFDHGERKRNIRAESEYEDIQLNQQLDVCLHAFDCLDLGDNLDVFKKSVRDVIKGCYLAFKPPTDPLKIVLNASVNCGLLLLQETDLWLRKITGSLRPKPSIRHPYYCEVTRTMPFDVLKLLRNGILHSRIKEITENVIYCSNKKAHVLSFTSKDAVLLVLSTLSHKSTSYVESRFRKKLKGRLNGRAEVIISPENDFSFIYKVTSSQLVISFRYGVWNQAGFPLHS